MRIVVLSTAALIGVFCAVLPRSILAERPSHPSTSPASKPAYTGKDFAAAMIDDFATWDGDSSKSVPDLGIYIVTAKNFAGKATAKVTIKGDAFKTFSYKGDSWISPGSRSYSHIGYFAPDVDFFIGDWVSANKDTPKSSVDKRLGSYKVSIKKDDRNNIFWIDINVIE